MKKKLFLGIAALIAALGMGCLATACGGSDDSLPEGATSESDNGGRWESDKGGSSEVTEDTNSVQEEKEHDWGEWVVTQAPTCTQRGSRTRTCKLNSSHTETEKIAALKHDYGDWEETTPATCTQKGTMTRVCKNDSSHTDTKSIATLAHNYVDNVCSMCGEAYVSNSLRFELNDAGNGYRVNADVGSDETEIYIPSTYKGLPVTEIADGAFSWAENLTKITLPSGLLKIGDYAFHACSKLDLTIPESVEYIGDGAFMDSGITEITIGKNLQYVGNMPFGDSALKKVVIEDGVERIWEYMFCRCVALTSVSIPSSVTAIGGNAFGACVSLAEIDLPDGLTEIGECAFAGCISLTKIVLPNGVTSISYGAFQRCESLSSVTFGEGVTYIDDYAFEGCTRLFTITLPASLEEIVGDAFRDCYRLTEVYNLSSLDIGMNADNGFVGCYAKAIYTSLDAESRLSYEGDFVLYKYGKEVSLIGYLGTATEVVVPDGVTTLGNYAFTDNSSITKAKISDSVTAIGNNSFKDCTRLTSVTIGRGVIGIGDQAFYNCIRLMEVYNLSALNIQVNPNDDSPWDTGYAGYYAKNVYTTETAESKVSVEGDYILYRNGDDVYLMSYTGDTSAADIVIPDGVTEILDEVFFEVEIASLSLPDSLKKFSSKAFWFSQDVYTEYENGFYLGNANNPYMVLVEGAVNDNGEAVIHPNTKIIADSAFENGSWGRFDDLTTVVIPDSVQCIGDSAFSECGNLTSLTLGKNVTEIGDRAFQRCFKLTAVVIPDSVTTLGAYALNSCYKLMSLTLGKNVTTIGEYAFDGCYVLVEVRNLSSLKIIKGSENYGFVGYYAKRILSLSDESKLSSDENGFYYYLDGAEKILLAYIGDASEIVIPDGVTSIGSSVFSGRESLTSVVIPDSVTSIGDGAFSSCLNLTSVALGGVKEIGEYAFGGCERLTSILFPDSVETIGAHSFSGCGLTSITFGKNVKTIGYSAFSNNQALTSLSLPSSVEYIGSWAFEDCASLESVTIGANAALFESSMFSGCSNLRKVVFLNGSAYTDLSDLFYEQLDDLEYTEYAGSKYIGTADNPYYCLVFGSNDTTQIHENTKLIASYAFLDCSSLTAITLPSGVIGIGEGAFYGCSALQTLTLPYAGRNVDGNAGYAVGDLVNSYVEKIVVTGGSTLGEDAFEEVRNCDTVVLPDGLTAIGDRAFMYSGVTTVNIPDSVTSIGESAFFNCLNLTALSLPSGLKYVGVDAFTGDYDSSCYTEYEGGTYLGNESNPYLVLYKGKYSTNIHNDTRIICSGAFQSRYLDDDTGINIPVNVRYIGVGAFENYTSLMQIVVAEGNRYYVSTNDCLIEIATKTLIMGSKNSLIPTDGSVTSIAENAFSGSGIQSITIPSTVKKIGEGAFSSCASLHSVTIEYGVTEIGAWAFYRCEALTEIVIPDSVTKIGESAFAYCGSLTSASLPSGLTELPDGLFADCEKLSNVSIPENVWTIGEYAFTGCAALTEITLPDSLREIGEGAFYECVALKSVSFGANVKLVGEKAFYGCTALSSISVDGQNTNFFSSGNCLIDMSGKLILGCKNSSIPTDGSVVTIGDLAFAGSGLIEITVPDGVTEIGYSAFAECTKLTDVVLPDSVKSLGADVFVGCSALKNVKLPNGITAIVGFGSCTALESITIPTSVYWIEDSAFADCTALKEIVIPARVSAISRYAFMGCSSLTSVVFGGDSLERIGYGAFEDCSSLTSITLPSKVTELAEDAFLGCLNLEEIYLPSSLESIGGCAFQNCEKLTIYYDGTMDDWNYNIYISGSWAYGADNITIVCTDGMLDKDGNEVEEVE